MLPRFTLCLLPIVLLEARGQVTPARADDYNPERWPAIQLSLSEQGTLKDVFESGLRPYRYPSLENSVLQAKHLRLKVVQGSGLKLPELPVEVLSIRPFDDGELSSLEARTPDLSIEEARQHMKQWLAYGKLDNGSPSEQRLEDYLEAVQRDLANFDHIGKGFDDGCRVRWREPDWKTKGGGPSCTVFFRKTSNANKPLFLNLSLNWSSNRLRKDRKYYRDPIPPPPGFETANMEAPENFGPDSQVDKLRAAGVDVGDGNGGIPYEDYVANQQQPYYEPSKEVSVDPKPESTSEPMGYLVAVLLAILAVFGCVLGIRRLKARSRQVVEKPCSVLTDLILPTYKQHLK